MSRDQRPGRTVMVDSARDRPGSASEAVAAVDQVVAVAPAKAKSRLLLPSILFLLACAIGAVGVAFLPVGGA